jgi:hypothetical protein
MADAIKNLLLDVAIRRAVWKIKIINDIKTDKANESGNIRHFNSLKAPPYCALEIYQKHCYAAWDVFFPDRIHFE